LEYDYENDVGPDHVCARASTQGDHVINIAEGGADEEWNMQGLCRPCHNRKTSAESMRGKARRRTPVGDVQHPGLIS
jgi:5-methylcytosine-specific restriction endonuclease McrA